MSTDTLRIEDLSVAFRVGAREVPVLRNVSFSVPTGETVALVGESGSGKSTIASAVMGLLPPRARITSGRILFNDPRAVTLPNGKPVWMQSNAAGETYAPFRLGMKESNAT